MTFIFSNDWIISITERDFSVRLLHYWFLSEDCLVIWSRRFVICKPFDLNTDIKPLDIKEIEIAIKNLNDVYLIQNIIFCFSNIYCGIFSF